MTIRPATPLDAPAIAHVHVSSWLATYSGIIPDAYLASLSEVDFTTRWTEWLAFPNVVIRVAGSEQGGLVGFASGGPIRRPVSGCDAELYAIYLLPGWLRRGIGQELVTHIEQELALQGHSRMLAWVLRDNPAVSFYQRLGGNVVAEELVDIGGVALPELAYAWTIVDRAKSVSQPTRRESLGSKGGPQ